MLYTFITLIAVAIILFGLSFVMNDRFSQIEAQFEQFSITTMQDTYQMKKKLRVLEEELLTEDIATVPASIKEKPLLIQKVYHLNQQGFSVEDISKQTKLNKHDIHTILKND